LEEITYPAHPLCMTIQSLLVSTMGMFRVRTHWEHTTPLRRGEVESLQWEELLLTVSTITILLILLLSQNLIVYVIAVGIHRTGCCGQRRMPVSLPQAPFFLTPFFIREESTRPARPSLAPRRWCVMFKLPFYIRKASFSAFYCAKTGLVQRPTSLMRSR